MWMPTRHRDGEGRARREVIDRGAVSIRRGNGNGTSEGRDEGRQERPVSGGARAPTSSSGRRLGRESDRGVRASRPGNSGGAKAPDFRQVCEAGEDQVIGVSLQTPTTVRSRPNKLYGKAKAAPIRRCRGPAVKSVGKPDAGNPHVRFDERGRETGRLAKPQATAPFLDSTNSLFRPFWRGATRGRRRNPGGREGSSR